MRVMKWHEGHEMTLIIWDSWNDPLSWPSFYEDFFSATYFAYQYVPQRLSPRNSSVGVVGTQHLSVVPTHPVCKVPDTTVSSQICTSYSFLPWLVHSQETLHKNKRVRWTWSSKGSDDATDESDLSMLIFASFYHHPMPTQYRNILNHYMLPNYLYGFRTLSASVAFALISNVHSPA